MSEFNKSFSGSSILPNDIISIFNDYYQIYLNGMNINLLIDLYISNNLYYIYKQEVSYKLINIIDVGVGECECEDLNNNLDKYHKIEFNKIDLGYLYIDFNILNNLNINVNLDILSIFISYLSIFIYNSKYVNRSNIINCSIFTEVLNMMNDGVIIFDINFKILFFNKTSEIILNKITKEDIYLNKTIFDLFSQLEDIISVTNIYKNKKINYKINKNNTDFNLILNINTILHNKIYYNILTINPNEFDIKKCDNIGFLSHELRNPLQSISFANQLVQMKLSNLNDIDDINDINDINNIITKDYKKYLDIIDKSVYDMIKIINDILDIDRINSNQINLSIDNINLKDLVQDIQFDFEKYLTNSNIKFEIILSNDIPITLYTDSTRIKQIIINILNNSVKYSKTNELNIITMAVTHNFLLKTIDFSIKDTGVGIKKENLKTLMELKPIISNNKNNSNGIGLYLCNKLSLLLDGNIKINSEYMKGSEFIFSHPIKLGLNNNIIKKNLEKFNILNKILIIDTDENITLLFKDILQNLKFKYNITEDFVIDCCNIGTVVCDMVKLNNYDIIFMDLYISDINGITLVKLLRKQYFNKKIIAMSTDISLKNKNDNNNKLFELFDDIIIKPFDENDILEKIKY